RGAHVDAGRDVVVGDVALGLGHPLASDAADAGQVDQRALAGRLLRRRGGWLLSGRCLSGGGGGSRSRLLARDVRLDVLVDDASTRTGAGDLVEVDAVLLGEALDQRRGAEALAGGAIDDLGGGLLGG